MIFDIETIIAVLLALGVGILFCYAYNKYKTDKFDKVFQVIEALYNEYGDRIKKDDPELAEECEQAIDTLKNAMEDGNITAMEALEISKVFVPLMNRLVKFIKENYQN